MIVDATPEIQLLERLRLPALELDASGRCHAATPEACRILDMPASAVAGTGFLGRMGRYTAFEFERALQRVFAQPDEQVQVNVRFPRSSGSHALLLVDLAPLDDGRVFARLQDLSVKQEVEDERSALFRIAPDPMAIASPDGYITHVNPAWTRLLGWTSEDMRRRPFLEFVHPDDRERTLLEAGNTFAGAVNRGFRNRYATRDGGYRHVEWSTYVGRDGRAYSAVRDVTGHAREREETEAQFNATFEQAAVGIAYVGLDGTWLRTNRRLCEFLGYPADELARLTFQDVTHPEDLQADLDLVQQVIDRSVSHYALEKRYVRRDGEVAWGRLTVSMRRDADGEALHFIAIIEDIADKKQAELALRHAQEELEARIEDRTRSLARLNNSLSTEVAQRREVEQQLRDNDTRLRSILQNSHDAFVAIDDEGRVTEWNRAAEAMFKWRRSEAIGRPMSHLIVPAALRERHETGMRRYVGTGESRVLGQRVELSAIDRTGREFPVELTISEIQLGQRQLFTAFVQDISARRDAEARRDETERQLRALTENSPAMVAYIDNQERYRYVNAAFLQWYEVGHEALVGRTVREFRDDAGYAMIRPYLARVLSGEAVAFEHEVEGPGGKLRYCQVTYIPDVDDSQRVVGFHAMIYDMTAQRDLARMLEQRAMRDELTGLPNRAAWKEELARGLARAARARTGAAVMFLDLDGFKQVNDTFGHEAGDEVLRQFATRLRASLRASDFIARLSGDEFVVLLDQVRDVEGNPPAVAAKILQAMQVPMTVDGHELRMAASIGVAVQSGPAFDARTLMQRADEAMYVAKRNSGLHFDLLHC